MPILDTNLIDYDVGFDISKLGELKFFASLDIFGGYTNQTEADIVESDYTKDSLYAGLWSRTKNSLIRLRLLRI